MINNTGGIELSEAHIAAVNRRRGVIINFAAPSHFDGIWPSWGRGRTRLTPPWPRRG